ncbi:hypothetical protein K474DRAFT_1660408 [Panus rudis PR-1116 ss-1]|nr:hypothetical protein K474DRAFT_1669057 [Panus rudis PR-1116 ss-1]KAI0074147.1 hypothetical protein K474DRAFT_1665726 [Panus rudis PR-1116 ss-1]KAI0078404.1 hypothetical protein K474DRAFT_1660408 [Panus rudis PR-1116 ss-1]
MLVYGFLVEYTRVYSKSTSKLRAKCAKLFGTNKLYVLHRPISAVCTQGSHAVQYWSASGCAHRVSTHLGVYC